MEDTFSGLRIRPRDLTMTKPFERRLDCHDLDDITVLYGNSEAFEAQQKQTQDFSFITFGSIFDMNI